MRTKRALLVSLSVLSLSSLHCATNAAARFDSGLKKFEAKDYAGAIAEVAEAIALDPKYAEAYNLRGQARRRALGDAHGAIADFTKAIELKPDYARAYNNRCLAWNQLRNWRAMADDAAKAVELDPEFGAAIVNRAIAYNEMGEHERARADYDLALRVDPRGRDGLDAYFHRAELNYRLGNYDEALSDLAECHALSRKIWPDYPNLSGIYSLRARCYVLQGDWSHADNEYALWDATNQEMESYDVLFWFVARVKLGVSGRDVLERYSKGAEKGQWPFPVFQMFLGAISYDECLRLAGNADAEAANGNRCEAYFYIAEQCLANGEVEAAREYFNKCVRTNATRFLEYRLAKLELENLR